MERLYTSSHNLKKSSMRKGKIFAVFDIAAAVLLGWAGVLWMKNAHTDTTNQISQGILGLYLLLFAIIIVLTALWYSHFFARRMSLVYSFGGKAFGLIFLGSIQLREGEVVTLAVGAILITLGLIYLLLQFISAVERPIPLLYFSSEPPPLPPAESLDAMFPPAPPSTRARYTYGAGGAGAGAGDAPKLAVAQGGRGRTTTSSRDGGFTGGALFTGSSISTSGPAAAAAAGAGPVQVSPPLSAPLADYRAPEPNPFKAQQHNSRFGEDVASGHVV